MGLLNYRRHAVLLVCLAVGVAATGPWNRAFGVVLTGGFYGALHASSLALTLRRVHPLGLRGVFIAVAAALSMSSVAIGLWIGRLGAVLPAATHPAALLALTSGLGAVLYAWLIRLCFDAPIGPRDMAWMASICVAATGAVLATGLYRHGGIFWFGVAWWFALSASLWMWDRRRA